MNFNYKYPIIIILVSFITSFSISQESALDRFAASEGNGKVFLDWVISSGRTCQGIRIQRSTDSLEFFQIGDIGGVCGNITSPQTYTFTDENPIKNVINYYRLELGGIGFSIIVSVKVIDFGRSGNQIRPNPITSESKIHFSNPTKLETQLIIYNLNGSEVLKKSSQEEYFSIQSYSLQSGIYLFTISSLGSSPFTRGKLMVQQ